jgi:hypothetical protein
METSLFLRQAGIDRKGPIGNRREKYRRASRLLSTKKTSQNPGIVDRKPNEAFRRVT